jgi:hypothetical protein
LLYLERMFYLAHYNLLNISNKSIFYVTVLVYSKQFSIICFLIMYSLLWELVDSSCNLMPYSLYLFFFWDKQGLQKMDGLNHFIIYIRVKSDQYYLNPTIIEETRVLLLVRWIQPWYQHFWIKNLIIGVL